jgi:hypothetical protein
VEADLQPPLQFVSSTPSSLPGSHAVSTSDGSILYTPGQGQGKHPTDVFSYTVQDAAGKRATGVVYVTIDTPPQFASVQQNFPSTPNGNG